jgi:hypothetical protein
MAGRQGGSEGRKGRRKGRGGGERGEREREGAYKSFVQCVRAFVFTNRISIRAI